MLDVHTDARRGVQRLPGLWPDEQELYELLFTYPDRPIHRKRKVAYENLSACRALLEKHQWVRIHADRPFPVQCLECEVVWHSDRILKHADDCAIAPQLAGVQGG